MIFAVINQKGGVGKTTLTLNLAAALLDAAPHRTLSLIDLDDQESLYRFRRAGKGKDAHCRWKRARFQLGTIDELPSLLDDASRASNHVLLDAPRSLDDALTAALLSLCDGALVPMLPEFDALLAAQRTMRVAEAVGDSRLLRGRPNLRARVAITHNSSGPHRRLVREQARECFAERLCRTTIPASSKVGEAAIEAASVLSSAPHSPAARAFVRLANELETSWRLTP